VAQAGGWPRREVEHYNHGFANRTLWPKLHGPIEQRVFEGRWWTAYCDVNEGFAAVEASRRRLRWVHDYHLMLVPSLLRRARVREPIGFFLHPDLHARDLDRRPGARGERPLGGD
jgi:trehalose-6-phosphate synthase